MTTPTAHQSSRRSGSSQTSSSSAEQTIGQFRRLEHIGKGSFAEVFRGIHMEKRQNVAIKSVNLSKLNRKLKENLVTEITILRSLHHPHVVSLIDCQETQARMHIIMEFCELGDLSAFIKKRADLINHPATMRTMEKYPNPPVGGLHEVIVRHFAKQIASALEFLRSKNYIHRDLKPQNLLLNPSSLYYSMSGTMDRMPLAADGSSLMPATGIESLPMLKIADFGFARILPTTSLAETLCGSPLYMAPEILRYEKYDAKADLWSVGTVLYEMMCARPPFRASNHVELARKIEDRKDQIKFTEGIVASRAMKTLIRALLKRKPLERMGYDQFFADPVIRDEIPGLVDEDLPQSFEKESVVQSRVVQKMPTEPERRAQESSYSQSPKENSPLGATPPSRPSSRPSSAQQYGSSPSSRPSSGRRASNTPLPTIEQRVPPRDRRPTPPHSNTAPIRTLRDRELAPLSASPGQRYSREESPRPSSALREQHDRERLPQRSEAGALKEAADRAALDSALDEGFVFVEKRRVEIDALADEIAASPQSLGNGKSVREVVKRRATTQGTPITSAGGSVPSKAIQIQQKQGVIHQRAGSYERRRQYRPSFETATSALSRAMNMVTQRGLNFSPPMPKGLSPPQGYAAFPTYPASQSSLLLVGEPEKAVMRDEDGATIKRVEELAQLSHVVFGFAEVKYKQLVPVSPSDADLGVGPSGIPRKLSHDDDHDDSDDEEGLTAGAIVSLSEEALVLYVKSLAILNKAMDMAGTWWNRRQRNFPSDPSSRGGPYTERLNHVVSWIRDRFNDCCAKSEVVARKLKQAQQQLPPDHASHPSNRSADAGSATTIGSADNILLTTGITAEKLMYDRALEMSRQAAVNELVGTDLPFCELNYGTAIRMLEAILEDEEEASNQKTPNDEINGLETEDREAIQKLLESMKARHRALKKKIQVQKAAKRTSITSAPAGSPHPASRSSPASQGAR